MAMSRVAMEMGMEMEMKKIIIVSLVTRKIINEIYLIELLIFEYNCEFIIF
jgi:hypothetical protein